MIKFCISGLLLIASTASPAWREQIPEVIYPDAALTELYTNTWRLAHGRIKEAPPGTPVSPYMDENCFDDQIWIWDTCFMAFFTKYCPQVYPGIESLENFYVPVVDHKPSPLTVHLYDNPPLFAWCELEHFRFTGDRKRVERIVRQKEYLQRHYAWFQNPPHGKKYPATPNRIYLAAVTNDLGITGFTWTGGASGMDNTPRGRDTGGYRTIFWIDAISQQALTAQSIAALYSLLGDTENEKRWRTEYARLRDHINAYYWDEEDGFYYDIEIKTGKPCRIKTPASFWPMLAGIPSREQAARMTEKLKAPGVFGGDFPIPTLARDDKDYNHETGDYWRGGIWLPTSYMVIKAVERYGFTALADELAEKTIRQQLQTWHAVTPNTIWECYSPSANRPSTEHGRRARPDFCGWSALGPISLLIENVMGFRVVDGIEKTIIWDLKREKGRQGIRRLRFGGILTDVIYDGVNAITVRTDLPYTLIVNGTRYPVAAPETLIQLDRK